MPLLTVDDQREDRARAGGQVAIVAGERARAAGGRVVNSSPPVR